ncbi:MAG: hypothetical protein L0099_03905 [Acidobacteria bacterium]|nr:hypothetical protein [Acidobacteriota bacterium]
MSELEGLFLVLFGVYLLHSMVWVEPEAVAFRQTLRRFYSVARDGLPLPAVRRKGVFVQPLPPLGGALVCPPYPLMLSPEGASAWRITGPPSENLGAATPPYLRFEEMTRIDLTESVIRIAGKDFVATAAPGLARHAAHLLAELHRLGPKQRAPVIDRALTARFDLRRVEKRLEDYRQASGPVRRASNLLFLALWVAVPVLAWKPGLLVTWPLMLILVLPLLAIAARRLWIADRQLHPEHGEQRWRIVLTAALSPLSAIRGNDELLHPLLVEFDPVAVARSVCAENAFRELASQSLRSLRFPTPGELPEEGSEHLHVREWFAARQLAALERFLAAEGLDPNTLLAPARESGRCLSYCPRCWGQYVAASGTCGSCGIALVGFPETPS